VGRFNKKLLEGDSLKAVATAAGQARATHYAMTLPWTDDGARILPMAVYDAYTAAMYRHRQTFEAAVSAFLADYDRMISEARIRLNGLFNADDYPPRSEVARRFRFRNQILPVPSGADFRVEIGDAAREDVEREVREATTAAMRNAVDRIRDAVERMAEKLRDYRGSAETTTGKAENVFRDSLVSNVRDLVGILPAFNLTDDPEFGRIAARIAAELATHDPEKLRMDPAIRREVVASAESILSDVSSFFA
jgi:hypothetical protein